MLQTVPDAAELRRMAGQFVPVLITVDTSHLGECDRRALTKLIAAARVMDDIFSNQLWSGNRALAAELARDSSPLGEARRQLFHLYKGPWSALDSQRAFLPDVPARKPLGANFYSEDMSREEFERFAATLPTAQAEQARGFFTIISRHSASGSLEIVPYHRAYQPALERAAALVNEAAALTANPSLQTFLEARAKAFLTSDYYESDLAWMDLDAHIDITIGPYETYADELFGYKAAFEAYVGLQDEAETKRLAGFTSRLQEVEDNLPIDPRYRNPKLAAAMPIRVVNQILCAGDANHGVQTAAFNLPNDERIILSRGSKKVMLKNVQSAKFETILVPIARLLLSSAEQSDLSFDAFFTHILAHEISHGIGPQTSVRLELKELYSAIEEAKADITALFMLQYFFDRGILQGGEAVEKKLYTTFLASAFRTLRFGIDEAHGRGMALQFNYLTDHGAFVELPDGRFEVNLVKIKPAVRALTAEILTIEARGDYAGARQMLDHLATLRPSVARALARLEALPVDILPQFLTADALS